MSFSSHANDGWGKVDQVRDELVWVLCFDAKLVQALGREVIKIERDDDGRRATDRRSEYMTIIGIGQSESFDQTLVSGDKAISDVSVHQRPGTFQLLPRKIGAILKYAPDPLVVDLVGPPGPEQICQRQVHEQVPQRSRIECARIIERCEACHNQ